MSKPASEGQIGSLHQLIYKLFKLKGESMLAEAEELILLDAGAVIDTRELNAIAKFVMDNGVICLPDAENKETDFHKRIEELRDKQKGKIVKFTGTDD